MRRSFLTLAVLLMALFLPNLAQATDSDLLLQITSPAINMTSGVTPDCNSALPSIENAMPSPAVFTPNPQQQTVQYCGVCSQSPCQGAERYSACGYANYDGEWILKRCDYYLGGQCSEDNQMICRCYGGPTP
jgi:hypothetical protein